VLNILELHWKIHIDYIYSKLAKFVGIFYKHCHKLPLDCLKMLYFSFVHPHILDGVEIYANTYTSYLNKLLKLNNKLLRILQQKNKYCRNIELYVNYTIIFYLLPNFIVLKYFVLFTNLLTIKNYCQRFIIIILLKTIKIHDYDTRNKNNLHLSTVNLCYGSRAITFKSCNLWNRLPEDIKCVQNITTFKNNLKELFYNAVSLC